jgi:acetolactate synthase-1/2/3 large subunit
MNLLETLQVPVLSTWQAADIIKDDHPLYVGRAGQYGQRHANFALQSCDLLICLGTRVALPQRGFNDEKRSEEHTSELQSRHLYD